MTKAIVVSTKWLKACGETHLDGVPLVVKEEKDFHNDATGILYTVALPDGRTWDVFAWRGIEIVEIEQVTIINRKHGDETVVTVRSDADMSKDFVAHVFGEDMCGAGSYVMGFVVCRNAYYVGHDEQAAALEVRHERKLDGFQGHPNGRLIDNMIRCWRKLDDKLYRTYFVGDMLWLDYQNKQDAYAKAYDTRNAKLYRSK